MVAVVVGSGVALAQETDEPLTVERVHHMLQGLEADFLIVGLELRFLKNRMSEMEKRIEALERNGVHEIPLSCLIVSDGNAIISTGHKLNPATISEFVEQYGEHPKLVTVSSVLLRPESGVLEVQYQTVMDLTLSGIVTIVEVWHSCEYVGAEFGRG